LSAVQEPIACHIESSVADAHVASKMMRDLMALAFDSQVTQRQFEVGGAFISRCGCAQVKLAKEGYANIGR
jgi:hypothetical protein